MRVAPKVIVKDEDRTTLERWARGRSSPVRLMQRAQIVLLASEGKDNKDIAAEVGVTRQLVGRWRNRYGQHGVAGIEKDAPGRGRKATRRDSLAAKIIRATTQTKPANATHWSTRTLAKHLGVSDSMVRRIWQANQLKPHLSRTFKLSNDPQFIQKVVDVVGLYLNPPEHALVLCCDEKSQIQALDRTQPGLPIKKGRCGTMTHDYKRNGTTTLFAALEVAEGKLIGTCMPRHRHQEWLKFLKLIDEQTPADMDLHLIADNYYTHKTPEVQRWLKRHPRFHMHFTPTSGSWLNLVERWFRNITDERIRRDAFGSVPQLIKTITAYIENHNQNPRTIVWTAKVEDILAKVARARAVLNNVQSI
jgi:transposase